MQLPRAETLHAKTVCPKTASAIHGRRNKDKIMNTLNLSPNEIDTIISWHNYCTEDSQHYGNGIAIFPQEQAIIDKLNQHSTNVSFSDDEIILISEWMDECINRKYGNATVLLGEEQRLFNQISEIAKAIEDNHQKAMKEILAAKASSKQVANTNTSIIQPTKSSNSKTLFNQNENTAKQITQSIKPQNSKLSFKTEEELSFEEKVQAAQKLKEEMKDIKNAYKKFKKT